MTQQIPGSPPVEIPEIDPLELLHADIEQQRERMRRVPPTAENAMAQMDGTVMSIMSELCVAVAQVRDGIHEQMDEMEERVQSAESAAFRAVSDVTQIEHEDAEKLTAVLDTLKLLIETIRSGAQQPPEVLQQLKSAEDLATECAEIIKDNRLDPEDDDEEDEEEGEEEEPIQASNGTVRGQA